MEEHSNRQRTPYLFTGKELDDDTQLYYFGARYYDPRTSVWQSPDPILARYLQGDGAGLGIYTPRNLNLFAYSHLRPVIMIDPDGMEPRGGEWLLDQALRQGHAALVWMLGSEENARAAVVGIAELHPVVGLASALDAAESPSDVGLAVGLELMGPLADGAKFGNRLLGGADDVAAAARMCSFRGDTLVQTDDGLIAISDIAIGDKVWSRNAQTGEMGWRDVADVYSNIYGETVTLTIRDVETGAMQTIVSNRIHPYFVQILGETEQVAMGAMELSSEGHVYTGPIPNGFWIDAADLQPGFRLLNGDQSWAEVVTVDVAAQELQAFNLTVDDFHTYFVAGNADADAVWVHNACFRAQQIAGGHAFDKHVLEQAEFGGLGIRTRDQFADLIDDVMSNPTHSGQLRNGRSYSYDETRNVLVIRDPNTVDGGTAFRPTDGLNYVNGLE